MNNYLVVNSLDILNFKLKNENIIVDSLSSLVNYNLDYMAIIGL
jgi:hypothetical protein